MDSLIQSVAAEKAETEEHHYGFISQPQQRKVATRLDKMDLPDDVIRPTIRDGGLFERFLERRGFDPCSMATSTGHSFVRRWSAIVIRKIQSNP
jgi:hypothetical protein